MGLSPDGAMLAYPPASMTEKGDGKVLTYHQPGGVVDELGFDSASNLEMVRETLADGRVGYEVHYGDYRDVGNGIKFPGQVDASFPKTGTTVEYQLPRETNMRSVFVDSSTTPVTFWTGSNHGAALVKVEPLD